MYHDFIVVKDFKHDMILGIDFLTARKAILDFDSQTLVIKNSVYPLNTKPGQEQTEVSLVRLAEDVDVFPRSDVQVKCSVSKKKQAGENFVSQLPSSQCFEDEPGILLANALVKLSKNKHIPWAIANETGRYLRFKKGQVLGIATKYREEKGKSNVSSVTTEETKQTNSPSDVLSTFNLDHVPTDNRGPLEKLLKKNIDLFVQKDCALTSTNVTTNRNEN